MTTATVTAKTMVVNYTESHLSLTGTNNAGETRTLTLDLNRCEKVWSDTEATIINETRKCGEMGQEFTVDFEVSELRILKNLHDRSVATVKPVAVQSNTGNKVEAMALRAARHSTGSDANECRLNRLDNAAKTLEGDVWYIDYDMSTELRQLLGCPCGTLWALGGVSISESVFVMRDADYQSEATQTTFAQWREAGIGELNEHREHPADIAKLCNRIRRRLDAEITKMKASIVANILKADERLVKAQQELDAREQPATQKDRQQVDASRDNRVRAILRNAWDDLASVVKSAGRFEESDSISEVVAGYREAVNAAARAFNAQMVVKHGPACNRLLVATK